MTPPLLLLDVDGVLNALDVEDGSGTAWTDWQRGHATADGRRWPITWSPSVVARLSAWHDEGRVEIQWLTTWGHEANQELRDLVGMPLLAVAGTHDEYQREGMPSVSGVDAHAATAPSAPDPLSGYWWKYEVVRRLVDEQPDRTILWVDDELWEPDDPFRLWAERQPRVYPIGPDPRYGLTEDDLAQLLDAVPST